MAATYVESRSRRVRRRTPRAVRRARTLAVLFALTVCAAVLLFPRLVHTQSHEPPTGVHHTVAYGDTLWDIAVAHAGNRDVREVVYQIRRLNGLSSAEIHPGQVLFIPTESGGR
ncbi:nucleoid-associated protein YgaU [Symbiobacterium terraclitae]|uniref:Nucleoid-associated protein YgaU n=1 Tax=Symbiobacterium terraclitae TaxID=557451 RepID=A0ABS4JMP2_9FIRM|nr:LysM peptidoglycan-binding domain-containing protein [Symbiobacterium terraclitae]MBP2016812.1 nucleoid-associated protein YgaU [Symbiobacterium terraclitae]